MKNIMNSLYDFARKRFLETAAKFGLEEKDLNDIERCLMFADPKISDQAFFDSIKKIFQKGKLKEYNELNPYVRDFQVLTNHYVNILPNGQPASRFLYFIDMTKKDYGRSQPNDYVSFMKLVHEAHLEIENFISGVENKSKRITDEFNKKLLEFKLGETMEEHEPNTNVNSVAHHILDWYFQAVPFNACKNTAKKLAAISLYVLKRFNEDMTGFVCCGYTNQDLSEFGGWKSKGSVAGIGTSAFYDVIYEISDPQLLFINHKNIKENWEKKLKKIAPAWENRLDEGV